MTAHEGAALCAFIGAGIGFAKTQQDQLRLLGSLPALRRASVNGDLPLLVGASRKGFLGRITGEATSSAGGCPAECNPRFSRIREAGHNKLLLGQGVPRKRLAWQL